LEHSFITPFLSAMLAANKHQPWIFTLSGYKTVVGVIDADLICNIKFCLNSPPTGIFCFGVAYRGCKKDTTRYDSISPRHIRGSATLLLPSPEIARCRAL